MNEELEQLKRRVTELENFIALMQTSATFPLPVVRALVANGFFKLENPLGTGVLYSTNGVISTITGASGGFYVATISGGTVNHFVSASNGVITSA